MLTQFHPVTNNAVSRAASGSLNNTTNPVTFSVNTGEGDLFPDPAVSGPFWVTAWGSSYPNPGADTTREVLLCTARSGDSLTCTRAQQDTSATAHAGSPFVGVLSQAEHFSELQGAVSRLERHAGTPDSYEFLFDDFAAPGKGQLTAFGATSGWGGDTRYTVDTGRIGVIEMQGGTGNASTVTLAGFSNYSAQPPSTLFRTLQGGIGKLTFQAAIKLPALATVSEDYRVQLGFIYASAGNSFATITIGSGAWLEYDRSVSANWRMCTASGGTITKTTSSTPVTASWVKLAVVINAAGTSVEYFVDGVSIGTVSTNIPTGTGQAFNVEGYFWWVAGAARTYKADYVKGLLEASTPR